MVIFLTWDWKNWIGSFFLEDGHINKGLPTHHGNYTLENKCVSCELKVYYLLRIVHSTKLFANNVVNWWKPREWQKLIPDLKKILRFQHLFSPTDFQGDCKEIFEHLLYSRLYAMDYRANKTQFFTKLRNLTYTDNSQMRQNVKVPLERDKERSTKELSSH